MIDASQNYKSIFCFVTNSNQSTQIIWTIAQLQTKAVALTAQFAKV